MAGRSYSTALLIKGDASGAVSAIKLTQAQLNRLGLESEKYEQKAKQASGATRGLHKNMFSLHNVVRQLAPAMGAMSAGFAFQHVVQASIAMDGYTRALEAVTGGAAQAASELKFLRAEANRVGVEFQPLVREFAKLAAAARHTSLEGDGVRDTFTSIIEISRVLNLSSEDTRGAIFALQQMISKGVVSAEELRRQLGERIPGSFGAMARAVDSITPGLKVTTQQLDKMLKAGQLITEDVLPAFNAELRKLAAPGLENAMKMPAAEFARLKNVIFELSVEAGQELLPVLVDASKALVVVLKELGPHVGSIARVLIAFAGFKAIAPILAGSIKWMKMFNVNAAAMGTAAAASGAAYKAKTVALKLMGGALAGLPGLLAIAAGAWWSYNQAQKQAKIEMNAATESLLAMKHGIDELGASQARDLRDKVANQMATLMMEINALEARYDHIDRRRQSREDRGVTLIQPLQEYENNQVKELRDEIARLSQEYTGLAEILQEVAARYVEAATPMTDTEKAAASLRKQTEGLIGDFTRKVAGMKSSKKGLIELAEETLNNTLLEQDQREALVAVIAEMREWEKITGVLTDEQKALAKAEKERKKQLEEIGKVYKKHLEQFDPMLAAYHDYQIAAENATRVLQEQGRSEKEIAEFLEILKNTYPELRDEKSRLTALRAQELEKMKQSIVEIENENAALEIAIREHITLAAAKMKLNGATEEEIRMFQEAMKTHEKLQAQYKAQAKAVGVLEEAIRRGVERMDDAFQSFWQSILSGGSSAMDSLKQLVIQTVSEIIHALTTRKLTTAITSAFLPSGTLMANGAQATGGGLGQLFSGGGTGGNPISLASMGSSALGLLSGNHIGMAFQNLPTWLGGTSVSFSGGAGMNTAGSAMFGEAGMVSNLGVMGAGALGYLGGELLFPDSQAGNLAGLGASIGMMTPLGPLGALIGGAIGAILGSFFKDRPFEASIGGENTRTRPDNQQFETPFGVVLGREGRGGWGDFADPNTPAGKFKEGILGFDTAIADMLKAVGGEEYIDDITALMADWQGMWTESSLTIENVLESRWRTMLQAFEEDVQNFVKGAEGLEEQVERLGVALTAQKAIASSDVFGTHTWQELIVVMEALQEEGEEVGVAFDRLMQMIQDLAVAGAVLSNYANSDLATAYADLAYGQQMTLFEAGQKSAEVLREALDSYDGSIESIKTITELTAQRFDMELRMLAEIDAAWASINSTLGNSYEKIAADMRSPEENYNYYRSQAEALAASLPGMTDPTMIAATVAQIDRYMNQSYGIMRGRDDLTDEEKNALSQEYLDFITEVNAEANRLVEQAREEVLEDSRLLREDVRVVADEIKDPLLFVAGQLGLSAEMLQAAALALSGAAPGGPPGEGIGDYGGGRGDKGLNRPHTVAVVEDPVPVEVTVAEVPVTVTLDSKDHDRSTRALIGTMNALIGQLQYYTSVATSNQIGGNLS